MNKRFAYISVCVGSQVSPMNSAEGDFAVGEYQDRETRPIARRAGHLVDLGEASRMSPNVFLMMRSNGYGTDLPLSSSWIVIDNHRGAVIETRAEGWAREGGDRRGGVVGDRFISQRQCR